MVGSQAGKSGGSVLQQLLLVVSAGAISGPILPIMAVFYLAMVRGWVGSVKHLSARRRYTLNSPMHSQEEDGEDWPAAAGPGSAVVAAPPRPDEVAARLEAAELAARLRELQEQRRAGSGSGGGGGGGVAAS